MLTLTRKSGQSIRINDSIRIVVRDVRGHQVRIGIEAPEDVEIHREEVYMRLVAELRTLLGAVAVDLGLSALRKLAASFRATHPATAAPPG